MALRGIKVIEMMGLAPGPFCGMILADFGATVTVVQKVEPLPFESFDVMSNGKRTISVNLKTPTGVSILKKLCSSADVLIDTYRPGVMEKLGLGPESLLKEYPQLVYARLSGYGQNGFYKARAGHDINYVAVSGVLSLLSKNGDPPSPPINLLADFGGGGLTCALGIVLALLERVKSGEGQVVDTSMAEGAGYLASWLFRSKALPIWTGEPGSNLLDGGAPFYGTYKTKDGKFMAVGALEPQFYNNFINTLGLSVEDYPQFSDFAAAKLKFEDMFLTKTQAEWCDVFDEVDACVTPVLCVDSVADHKHNANRRAFSVNTLGQPVPEPAPKLSRTPAQSCARAPAPQPGQHSRQVLLELGYNNAQIDKYAEEGHIMAKKMSSL